MAGVWEPGATPEAPPTVALVTVAANAAIQVVHDRMPAILRREEEAEWLNPQNPAPEAPRAGPQGLNWPAIPAAAGDKP